MLPRVHVDRVVVERSTSGGTRATGVLCTADNGARLEVTARRAVVLASGALHTPCVLLRSGLGGPKVGRHLRLHPVTGVTARYDRVMKLYEGTPTSAICDVAEVRRAQQQRSDAEAGSAAAPTHVSARADTA